MAGWDEGRVFATRGASLDSGLTENGVGIVEADYHQLAGFASEMLSTAEVSARFSRFLRGFQDDNIFVYRYASWVFVGLERSARARASALGVDGWSTQRPATQQRHAGSVPRRCGYSTYECVRWRASCCDTRSSS